MTSQVHAKFQVRVKFASMCFFVDSLSGEEEGEEKKLDRSVCYITNTRCSSLLSVQ